MHICVLCLNHLAFSFATHYFLATRSGIDDQDSFAKYSSVCCVHVCVYFAQLSFVNCKIYLVTWLKTNSLIRVFSCCMHYLQWLCYVGNYV